MVALTTSATLYLVPTPIGHLGDVSTRIREILSSVDIVLCEDTRHTGKLWQLLQLPKKTFLSYHKHNEQKRIEYILSLWQQGKQIALVSDAGTPAISDPGSYLVDAAHQAGVPVVSVPGPCSIVCAVAASGFIQKRFMFEGFLPRQTGKRQLSIRRFLRVAPAIVVFLESPERLLNTLEDIAQVLPAHTELSLSKEISKKYEEHKRGSAIFLVNWLTNNPDTRCGEWVCCVQVLPLQKLFSFSIEDLVPKIKKAQVKYPDRKLKDICAAYGKKYDFLAKDLYNAVLKGFCNK